MLWADAKKARRIKTNMWKDNIEFHQLPYREMEHLRQVWARGRCPEVHDEVIKVNQELRHFSFLSCSPLINLFPSTVRSSIELNKSIRLFVRLGFIQSCSPLK